MNDMERYIKWAMTRNELAEIYGVSTKTLKKWFNNKGIDIPRGIITPEDQRNIFLKLGLPKNSESRRSKEKNSN